MTQTLSGQVQRDSQFGGVLGDVVRYLGEFLVGAVDRGALAAALLGAGQVGEAVPSELAAVVLRTWPQPQAQAKCHTTASPLEGLVPWCLVLDAASNTNTGGKAREEVVIQGDNFELA